MKIVVMNFSGNVGKSTIAGQLLKPRMNNAPIIAVESINQGADADGIELDDKLRGKKYGELAEKIMMVDDAIVDVGASNVEEFLKQMQQFSGSHSEFDYFIVPVIKESKVQADTINTIRALNKIGVPASKIRIVFNKLETDETALDEFPAVLAVTSLEKLATANPRSVIYTNEAFERCKAVKKTLSDISTDKTDYRKALKEAKSEDEKTEAIRMIQLQQLAVTANKNLDDVYKALFK